MTSKQDGKVLVVSVVYRLKPSWECKMPGFCTGRSTFIDFRPGDKVLTQKGVIRAIDIKENDEIEIKGYAYRYPELFDFVIVEKTYLYETKTPKYEYTPY